MVGSLVGQVAPTTGFADQGDAGEAPPWARPGPHPPQEQRAPRAPPGWPLPAAVQLPGWLPAQALTKHLRSGRTAHGGRFPAPPHLRAPKAASGLSLVSFLPLGPPTGSGLRGPPPSHPRIWPPPRRPAGFSREAPRDGVGLRAVSGPGLGRGRPVASTAHLRAPGRRPRGGSVAAPPHCPIDGGSVRGCHGDPLTQCGCINSPQGRLPTRRPGAEPWAKGSGRESCWQLLKGQCQWGPRQS